MSFEINNSTYDDNQIIKNNEKLDERLSKDRIEWKDKINDLVFKIKNINDLADCQITMLSYRQILLDRLVDFKTMIYKRKSTLEKYYKSRFRYYTIDYDIKLSSSEKSQFIKADLSALSTQIDMLQSHIDYYYECIKTLDNLAFAIRNRIRLEDEN